MIVTILTSSSLDFTAIIEYLRNRLHTSIFQVEYDGNLETMSPEDALDIFNRNHDSSLLHIINTNGFVPKYIFINLSLYVIEPTNQDPDNSILIDGIPYRKY